MEIELDIKDFEEIERNYDALAKWLTGHFTSFSAAAFALQSIMEAVDRAKKEMDS